MTEQRKPVAVISGGLDAMLATRVIQNQGIKRHIVNVIDDYQDVVLNSRHHDRSAGDRSRRGARLPFAPRWCDSINLPQ
jgi:hypothetical protein